jgi:hypothetical protein
VCGIFAATADDGDAVNLRSAVLNRRYP